MRNLLWKKETLLLFVIRYFNRLFELLRYQLNDTNCILDSFTNVFKFCVPANTTTSAQGTPRSIENWEEINVSNTIISKRCASQNNCEYNLAKDFPIQFFEMPFENQILNVTYKCYAARYKCKLSNFQSWSSAYFKFLNLFFIFTIVVRPAWPKKLRMLGEIAFKRINQPAVTQLELHPRFQWFFLFVCTFVVFYFSRLFE